MSHRMHPSVILAAALWLGGGACGASDLATGLRHNPFERPASIREAGRTPASPSSVQAPPRLELRGTLHSGRPLAIIGERVVGIGEEVSGYRLVSVQEGKARLTKDGTQLVLSVDGNGEGTDGE